MRRVVDYIRDHVLGRSVSLEELRQTEWSDRFEFLMRNRMLMGAYRYARLYAQGRPAWDVPSSIERRIALYRETGNQEHLVDIANLAMVEFVNPSVDGAHFSAHDDGEHTEKK